MHLLCRSQSDSSFSYPSSLKWEGGHAGERRRTSVRHLRPDSNYNLLSRGVPTITSLKTPVSGPSMQSGKGDPPAGIPGPTDLVRDVVHRHLDAIRTYHVSTPVATTSHVRRTHHR